MPVAAGDQHASLSNTVKWSTASEVNNFGYDVYRSESRDGPYQRITPQPILGQDTTDLLTEYEYADHTIAPDTLYFYYVQSISMEGKRKRITPVIQAPVKTFGHPVE
jgi:hypothetical protein